MSHPKMLNKELNNIKSENIISNTIYLNILDYIIKDLLMYLWKEASLTFKSLI